MGKNLSKSARPPAMILGLTCANLNGYSFCSICQFVDTLPLSREIFVEDDDCIWSEYYIPDVLDSHLPGIQRIVLVGFLPRSPDNWNW